MNPIPIHLAVEDDLSEWVLRRILWERPTPYNISRVSKKNGSGYLKKRCEAFNNAAKASPVLMLTDLDAAPCAPGLLAEWLERPRHPDFLFRVAVREVEAWVLACDRQFTSFLGIRKRIHFPAPEALRDPKAKLLELGAMSPRRDLREAITRRDSSGTLRQGPAYNSTLAEFLNRHWDLETATGKCPSLRKLLAALASLEEKKT